MLLIVRNIRQLSYEQLMRVYHQSNQEKADRLYRREGSNNALRMAEQDFYNYLDSCFFRSPGAFYVLWEEKGEYCSALRMEPYQDGMLLSGLETAPEYRRQGYGERLLREVLALSHEKIYSHVEKRNKASMKLHLKCGFLQISDVARYLDGSVSSGGCTMLKIQSSMIHKAEQSCLPCI